AGVCLGLYMSINDDLHLLAVHAHVNLVGWASLAVFALAHRSFPQLAASRLAPAHLCLSAPRALVMPFGIYLAQTHNILWLLIGASLLGLAGAVVFLAMVAGIAFSQHSTTGAKVGE